METSSHGEQGEGCWQAELCGERGVLEAEGVSAPQVGEMLNIGLRLSSGGEVDFNARVCGSSTDADGRVTLQVEFSELSVAERNAFARWQRLLARREGCTRVRARVAPLVEIDVPSNWHRGSWRA